MYTKPASVPVLEKGKALSSVDGVVDFWNWAATFVFNLTQAKGEGIEIDMTVQDAPKLRAVYV